MSDRKRPRPATVLSERLSNFLTVSALVMVVLSFAMCQTQTSPQYIGAEGSPVAPVPAGRWGSLKPVFILADSTAVAGAEPGAHPFPFDLDIEGNTLFIATGSGIKLYNVSDPASPRALSLVAGESSMMAAGLTWGHSDKDFYITNLDAPPGDDGILATEADEFGLVVWDTRNKSRLGWHYQDDTRHIHAVYVTRLPDGRLYAFGAENRRGLALYDLTAARGKTKCKEREGGCGVFAGLLSVPELTLQNRVHGVDDLVLLRTGATGVKIYGVEGPAGYADLAPRLDGILPGVIGGDAVLFERDYDRDGASEVYMVALSSEGLPVASALRIYDVTCIRRGSCALPPPVAIYDVTDPLSNLSKTTNLSLSVDDGTPYLYVGNEFAGAPGRTVCAPQREFLLDLSRFDPSSPPALSRLDLTPDATAYWGWYYQECHVVGDRGGPGFNDTKPMRAKVKGRHLFRAMYSFGDVHEITPAPSGIFSDGFESGDTSAWRQARQGFIFEIPGPDPFYTVTPEEPARSIWVGVPPGEYSEVRVSLDVTHGGWSDPVDGRHKGLWVAIDRNFYLVGAAYFRGPDRNIVRWAHGVGLPQTEKPKAQQRLVASPGETYRFEYNYNPGIGAARLEVFNRGKRVVDLNGVPNVSALSISKGQRILIVLGSAGDEENEPPPIGWTYSNLRFEAVKEEE